MPEKKRESRSIPYVPRTATIEIRLEGALVRKLRITNEQARQFNRLLGWLVEVGIPASSGEGFITDEHVLDAMTAAIFHAYGEHYRPPAHNDGENHHDDETRRNE